MARHVNAKKDTEYKFCIKCRKEKPKAVNFYTSDSPLFEDGRVPLCKKCIQDEINVADINTVKKMLRQIDKPFIAIEWQKCLESGKEPFGWYLRQISSLHQYKGMGYEDSIDGKVDAYGYKLQNDLLTEDDIFEKPTIEIIRKWGTGYSNKEYYELESTWKEMSDANDISTPQHRKQLIYYCKIAILLDRAIDEGDPQKIERLNKQFLEIQKNSGFRPIDRKNGSESSGIRSFGVIFEEVERDGFIEPWDIEVTQDIVDKTILYMANYTRKLLNMDSLYEVPDDAPQVDGDE
jgi:hypothetical protein